MIGKTLTAIVYDPKARYSGPTSLSSLSYYYYFSFASIWLSSSSFFNSSLVIFFYTLKTKSSWRLLRDSSSLNLKPIEPFYSIKSNFSALMACIATKCSSLTFSHISLTWASRSRACLPLTSFFTRLISFIPSALALSTYTRNSSALCTRAALCEASSY